ncbi:hypothetical protein GXP70_20700 [Paenibacillus lycopersici]|uniref:Lipoprotein n=1 Tax=Paenibacillus lycopersici TaxID=2704462 RepID=A0A6C0G581_9BACL|nr:hypothetical protein [Paenibacillus lycopersici]QHT62160.1 hypothetical protein GXP70_20700 [Paenibacillus lycopersici]
MRRWLTMAVAAAALLSGCGTANREAPAAADHDVAPTGVLAHEMPAEMPADFDFRVRYGYGMKDEIDTYADKVTKDLIVKGTAAADLKLSDSEMQAIYAKMKTVHAMRLTDLNPANTGCSQVPYNQASWTITAAGETRTLTWSGEHCDIAPGAKKLLELQTYVSAIVQATEAYQALPAAEGGYD